MSSYERFGISRNLPQQTQDSSLIERVNRIYQHTKGASAKSDLQSRLMLPSGFLQKRLDILNSGRTNSTQRAKQKLFEKATDRPKQPSKQMTIKRHLAICKFKATIVNNLRGKFSNIWLYKPVIHEESVESSIALARCPRCSFACLTLLTSSDKENLSPRFINKIKALLPGSSSLSATQSYKQKECLIASCAITESLDSPVRFNPILEEGSPGPKDDISLCVYADDQEDVASYKLADLPDLSIIPVEPCSILSFESPPFSRGNHSEFKFNDSRYGREDSYFEQVQPANKIPKAPLIPRLNISEFSRKKPSAFKSPKERLQKLKTGLDKLVKLQAVKLQRTFDLIYLTQSRLPRETQQSLTFDFSRDEPAIGRGNYGVDFAMKDEDEHVLMCSSSEQPMSKMPTHVRNSAFKLLSTRLNRLLQERYKLFIRHFTQRRYRY